MSPRRVARAAPPAVAAVVERTAVLIGAAIYDGRTRRRWTLRRLAHDAGLSLAVVQGIETGRRASMESYVRLAHALGFSLEVELTDPRRRRGPSARDEDPVHAAMGELEAAHLRGLGFEVAIDEPYQHYQFAGRADVVAWSASDRALLHIENRTRFPNLQEAAGSYNAKRAYLGAVLAERLRIRGGFGSETHVLVGLWSDELLHTLRLRRATFRSVCPDAIDSFEAWWEGKVPSAGRTSAFVLLDPFAAGRMRLYVDLETATAATRPRVRDYAEAARRVSSGRLTSGVPSARRRG
jgi:transcriptional regulator with XRE-family HTH domain